MSTTPDQAARARQSAVAEGHQDERWPPRLARLAERLSGVEDFPAISGQLVRVMQIADHEQQSLRALTDEILKDAALTNKMLRVVNAARFTGHHDGVGTVSRAISLLGVATVKRIALSLVVLEHLENRYHAHWLRQAYLKTLLAAQVTVALSAGDADPEEAFLVTLFQQLGPLVALCHFPEVTESLNAGEVPTYPLLNAASTQELGAGLEELGAMAATLWTLPEGVRHSVVRPGGTPPARALKDRSDRLRWVARAAHDVSDVLCDPVALGSGGLERVARSYLPVLGRSLDDVMACIARAQEQWLAGAAALGFGDEFGLARSGSARAVQGVPSTRDSQPPTPQGKANASTQGTWSAEQVLAQGLDDMTGAMLDGAQPQDQVRIGLEAICRALGLSRIALCRRPSPAAGNSALQLWVALGPQTESLQGRFQLQPGVSDDPLSTLVGVGKDVWLPAVGKASWLPRLPSWLAPSRQGGLLLLPLHHAGKLVGAIYADGGDGSRMPADIPARALLQSLRRLLVMAVVAP